MLFIKIIHRRHGQHRKVWSWLNDTINSNGYIKYMVGENGHYCVNIATHTAIPAKICIDYVI